MNINHTKRPTQPSRAQNSAKTQKKSKPEQSLPKDSFMDSYGCELMAGGALGLVSAVPLLGAVPTTGLAWSKIPGNPNYYEPMTGFEMGATLGFYASAAANVAGTVALLGGDTKLGLSLLGGSGLLAGSLMALSMDGGSLASRLGLQR
jgi:hypothetical protein